MVRYRKRSCGILISITFVVSLLICDVLYPRSTNSVSFQWPVLRRGPSLFSQSNKSHVVVITQFPLMTDPHFNLSRYFNASRRVLEARMMDYVEALHKTLAHFCVKEVHVLYDQDGMPGYLETYFGRHPKLKLHKIIDAYTLLNTFEYVHEYFQNQLVMVTNGDIYPDQGLEKLDFEHMKKKRLLYSPSRHTRTEKRCKMSQNWCYNYIGSHDSYIFVPDGTIPRRGKALLSYHWDDLGVESLILKMYLNNLSYVLWNPCRTIRLYHIHCSGLRHRNRPERIDYPKGVIRLPSRRELI